MVILARQTHASATYIEVFPSISTTGVVVGSGCPWGSGDIFGIKNFSGTFNSGTQISTQNGDTICGVYVGGYGYTMEHGWAQGGLTTPDGTYYTYITHSGSAYTPNFTNGTIYYWRAIRAGGVWSGMMSDFYVSKPIPTNAYVSPVRFTGEYRNNTGYNNILIYLSSNDTGDNGTHLIPIDPTKTNGTFDVSYALATGNYYALYRYYNSTNYTFGTWYPYENALIYNFSVVPFITNTIVYEDCTTGDIACYLRNALVWAFTVPDGTFEKFSDLKETLRTKAPFGYASSVYDVLGGFNDTGTATFTLKSIPVLNTLIFDPIRLGLSWLFYIAFAFALYHRFKDINV